MNTIIDQIKAAFVRCVENDCLEITNSEKIEIFDDEIKKRCFIRSEDTQPTHFTILNPSKKEIAFLAIDKCVFFDEDNWAKCDFVVFDDKTFCFIEIKQANRRQRSKRKKKAIQQLKATVKLFTEKLDFEGYQLEAHICFGGRTIYPSRPARMQSVAFEFQKVFQAKLLEENEKKF